MSLLSLPNEILLVVFCHFDDPYPLFPLSTLCRRLHFLCLPVYLSRRGVCDDGFSNISIDAEQVDALSALQTSLFLTTLAVQSLRCTFSNPFSQNRELARFHRLCSMLTSIGTAQLRFSSPPDDYPGGTQATYFTLVVGILNKTLENSCTTLTVDTPTPPGVVPAKSSRKRALRYGESRQPPRGGIFTSSISLSPAALRRRSLSTFRIHSEILLAPHCRAWTIDVLNSFPLTSLSIHTPSVSTNALDALLSQTEIPTLSDLKLVHSRITPACLHLFLVRHPGIISLHLDNLFVPSAEERLPPGFLPGLATLSAGPAQIAYLLHAMPPPAALRTVRVYSHMTHVDLLVADASLRVVAPRLAPPVALTLVLPVPTNLPRKIPDVDVVLGEDSALRSVSTLEFIFADAEVTRALASYSGIAKWAAPFPSLRTVELVGCSAGADTSRILAAFLAHAPGVERVVYRTA